MSRYRRGAWGANGAWPYTLYCQQPGVWSEQTMEMGFGQRPGRTSDACPTWPNIPSGGDQSLSLDALGSMFTRLILHNHLTRLAGDTIGLGGRGLWECSHLPAQQTACPAQVQNACSLSSPSTSCHNHHPRAAQQQASNCGGINMCGHKNNINVCHTCPAATRPYIGTNNVFVIPAAHVQPLHAGAGGFGNMANFNVNHNSLNTFLNGLGTAMNSSNGCGGLPMGIQGIQGGFPLNDFGVGVGGPAMPNGLNFSCRGCNFQM